jgi:hypothetical protein
MSDRYEEVRRKLVTRGYLQGRIERFLLEDAIAAEGPRALALPSLKAALLGAPLVGGLLAASTVASNRPSLGARDALVLWLYFAILAAVALFVLDMAAAAAASAWTRRRGARPADALRAGLIVAVPVLVYLAILWALGHPGHGLGVDALFLAGATATATLVAWLAGLVSLAGIVGRTGELPDRNRRFAVIACAVLLPVGALLLVIAATTSTDARAVPPSAFVPQPAPSRVLVVGIDGLDGALVEAAAADGGVEQLMTLLARGALYAKHREPAEPPEVWTTIATGMPADAHGVRQAGAKRIPGIAAPIAARSGPVALDAALRFLLPARTVPASGAGRRVRTLWEMAGLSRRIAVVGWWASWPARGTEGDSTEGYVVSDRTLATLLLSGTDDRDTAPASFAARLTRSFAADRSAFRASFESRFATLPEPVRALAWESFLIDSFAWRTSSTILDDPEVRMSLTYLPGLDILRTRLSSRADAGDAVGTYLRWLDATVFADLAARPDRIVLIADPGRTAPLAAEGFVAVVGGGVAPQCVGPTIGDLDVAPIVLRVASLPVSREMPGRAPERCFEPAGPAIPEIVTWGRRGLPADSPSSAYDPELVDRLKSLGYLR